MFYILISNNDNVKVLVALLLNGVVGVPVPQRRHYGRGPPRRRGGYYRPPPQQSSSSNYFNTILPLKVAGGVGLAAGFGLSQVLNGK